MLIINVFTYDFRWEVLKTNKIHKMFQTYVNCWFNSGLNLKRYRSLAHLCETIVAFYVFAWKPRLDTKSWVHEAQCFQVALRRQFAGPLAQGRVRSWVTGADLYRIDRGRVNVWQAVQVGVQQTLQNGSQTANSDDTDWVIGKCDFQTLCKFH